MVLLRCGFTDNNKAIGGLFIGAQRTVNSADISAVVCLSQADNGYVNRVRRVQDQVSLRQRICTL